MERPASRRRRPLPAQPAEANGTESSSHTDKPRTFAEYCTHNIHNAKNNNCLLVFLFLILIAFLLRFAVQTHIIDSYSIQGNVNISNEISLPSSLLPPSPELHPENH